MLEPDVVLAEAELEVRRRRLQPVRPMREQRALRLPGRAAGVEHDVRIVLVDRDGDVVARLAGAPRARRGRDRSGSTRARQLARSRVELGLARRESVSASACPTTAATSPAVKRALTGTTIAPSFSDGEVDDRILDPVRRHDGDAIAAADAEPRERPRELVRARVERRVRHPIVADRRTPSCSPRTRAWRRRMSPRTQHYLSSIRISR